MNRLLKKGVILLCAGMLCFCLGCQNINSLTNSKPKVQDTLPVGTFAVDNLSKQITNLIVSQMLPDDDTISVMFTEAKEAKEKLLCENVGSALIQKGYAVERVLPKEERQKGDVSQMSASGVKLTLNIIKLMESDNYFNIAVSLKGIKYYRMYALVSGNLEPVSAWTMASL